MSRKMQEGSGPRPTAPPPLRSWRTAGTVALTIAAAWLGMAGPGRSDAAAQQATAQNVYSFKGGKDGTGPQGSLALDAVGHLGVPGAIYGVTQHGGTGPGCESNHPLTNGCGTVYRLRPPVPGRTGWLHEVLYHFSDPERPGAYGNDGIHPISGLVLDARRKSLYGTTQQGGDGCPHIDGRGCGTVFEMKPPATAGAPWRYKVLRRFTGGEGDGALPVGKLTLAGGRIYGVTEQGGFGSFGNGVVFRLMPPVAPRKVWPYRVLYKFKGGLDGATPKAGVTISQGMLYGTTNFGGGCTSVPVGCGIVYRLRPPPAGQTVWKEDVLYRFKGGADGSFPMTGVVVHAKGGVFGTTRYGGFYNSGILFGLRPPASTGAFAFKKIADNEQEVGYFSGQSADFDDDEEIVDPDEVQTVLLVRNKSRVFVTDSFMEKWIAAYGQNFGKVEQTRALSSSGGSGEPVKDRSGDKWYAPCDSCDNGRLWQYGPDGGGT